MLIISLILLLLSDSMTSRRDKSILYSRTTITILLIAICISYDNLYFLFLNKGMGIFRGLFHSTSTTMGIFRGLFHSTSTTDVFHVFILSITSLILLTSFYTLFSFAGIPPLHSNKEIYGTNHNLQDINNSPIQLIDQLKGYYYINPVLSLSLAITLFSFAGIPPLIGFFGKQMILSAAIDNGYIFMALVATLTSVISAVYYLAIIKQIFFDKPDYTLNTELNDFNAEGLLFEKDEHVIIQKVSIKIRNIVLSSYLSLYIAIITFIIALFIFIPESLLNLANILALILFNL